MNLANKITITRIVLLPLFIISLLQKWWPWPVFIYIPIMLSDCIDGYVARIKNQQSKLGAFLDPLADRLLLIFTFITLSYQKIIPLWLLTIVLSRDIIVISGWGLIFLITNKKEIVPRTTGKIAVILQMFFVLFVLLAPDSISRGPFNFEKAMMYITGVVTVLSAIDYVIIGVKKLSKYE